MKKIINPFYILLLVSFSTMAQDITGSWYGLLQVQGIELRLVFHIQVNGASYKATMDSPDQHAKDIAMDTVTYSEKQLFIQFSKAQLSYNGELESDTLISGTFKQGLMTIPMKLSRKEIPKVQKNRPQEPHPPFPYKKEEVRFENTSAGIFLAGTLTIPTNLTNYPLVILISGSGPQNRDEELMGHKPFLVLADYLTRHGIAVLRYDDRGTAKSGGDFSTATSLDFSYDAAAAVNFIQGRKDLSVGKIGLVGHSEGGMIAPMLAARDTSIGFIVLMAGTGIQGADLLLLQKKLLEKKSGISDSEIVFGQEMNRGAFNIILADLDETRMKDSLLNYFKAKAKLHPEIKQEGMSDEQFSLLQYNSLASPWMRFFIRYNPAPTLEKVTCPVLAINGSNDLQVPSNENLKAISKALKQGGNHYFTIKELPNLNHLFQECKTGLPDEYASIEQTISPVALEEIATWILKNAAIK